MPTYAQVQTAIQNARSRGDDALADQIEQTYLGGPVPSPTRTLGAAPIAMAQGATLGLADELIGALGGRPAMEATRRELEQFRRESPGAALASEMIGGIPAGLGVGAGVGMAARAPGMVGRIGRAIGAPTVTGQAALGGIEGAVAGAAGGRTPSERIAGGLVGAGLGAGLGGVAAPVTKGLARRFMPGQQAEAMVRKELAAGGTRPEDYPRLAREAAEQPERTLAELGGPITEQQAVVAHATGGRARDIAEQSLEPRRANMSNRLIDALGENIGTRESFTRAEKRLTQQAAREASPLYDAARAAPFQTTPELAELGQRGVETGDIRSGYESARREMRLEGERIPSWDELVKEAKENQLVAADFDLSTWDAIKRGLDSRYRQLVRENPSLARALWRYRQEIVEQLDEAVPDYAKARRAFAGPMEQREALEAGKRVFREDPEYTEDFVRDLSQGEKDAYAIGAAQAIRNKLKNVPPEGGMPRFTDLAVERMQAAFPDDASFRQFWNALTSERDMQRFRNLVLAGSQTARIQAGQERQGRLMGLGRAAGELFTGHPEEAARTAVGQMLPRRQTLPEAVGDPLAEMLFARGTGIPPVLQRLQRPPITPTFLPGLTATEAAILGQLPARRVTAE